jgi:hypothetical protein
VELPERLLVGLESGLTISCHTPVSPEIQLRR